MLIEGFCVEVCTGKAYFLKKVFDKVERCL